MKLNSKVHKLIKGGGKGKGVRKKEKRRGEEVYYMAVKQGEIIKITDINKNAVIL